MSEFETHAVLSTCTGKLMGDIGGVYEVTSFLIGRPAYTHELAYYGEAAQKALLSAHPELPSRDDFAHVNGENFKDVLSEWTAKLGDVIELNEALKDVLADDRSTVDVLQEMRPDADITIIKTTDE